MHEATLSFLQEELVRLEFRFVRHLPQSDEFVFSRNSPEPALYGWLHIHLGGSARNVAAPFAALSVIRSGFLMKGLAKTKLIRSIATDGQRGWSILGDVEEERGWVERLITALPAVLSELHAAEAYPLLAETASARQAVQKYASILRSLLPHGVAPVSWYKSLASNDAKRAADELSVAGICNLRGQEQIYAIAVYLVAQYALEVEGASFSWNRTKFGLLEERGLVHRLELIVDLLLNWP